LIWEVLNLTQSSKRSRPPPTPLSRLHPKRRGVGALTSASRASTGEPDSVRRPPQHIDWGPGNRRGHTSATSPIARPSTPTVLGVDSRPPQQLSREWIEVTSASVLRFVGRDPESPGSHRLPKCSSTARSDSRSGNCGSVPGGCSRNEGSLSAFYRPMRVLEDELRGFYAGIERSGLER